MVEPAYIEELNRESVCQSLSFLTIASQLTLKTFAGHLQANFRGIIP
ncbi:MAG: hypothetical protein F6K23_05890 [Okeania sp. SIO2C9]|nr:hypothetical protein [Okeania sp. SIO2C9]NEQ72640.1 hypothetical protein [Okeania sp. SIO2C9]